MIRQTLLYCMIISVVGCSSEVPKEVVVTFEDLTFDQKHAQIQNELEITKASLALEGHYSCCVQPTCNFCLVHEKQCECAISLQAGEAVCGECGQLWQMGKGIIADVNPKDVKWGPENAHLH